MTIQLTATLPDGRAFKTKPFDLSQPKAWSLFDEQVPIAVGGPQIKGARVLGNHTYATKVTDDLFICATRPSNAAARSDGTGHAGRVYYESIELEAPGWKVEFERRAGMLAHLNLDDTLRVLDIVPSGRHVFPSAASFIRRAVFYRNKVTPEQAREWLDKVTEREIAVDAQKRKLPRVPSQEPRMWKKLGLLRTALSVGAADLDSDVRTGAMGPFQPPGSPLAYEHGGQGIYFLYSWEQCRSGALFWRTVSDLFMERMPCVFDMQTGERITPEQWAKGAGLPYQPFSLFLTGDEEYRDTQSRRTYLPPCFDGKPFNPQAPGWCPYENSLLNYDGIDGAHMIRALGPASAVAAQLDDPVAKDFVLDMANWCRMSWCDIGLPPGPYRSGLPTMRSWGGAKGGQGRPSLGREAGWVARAFADGHRFAPEGPEKAGLARNGQALLSMALFAAMPSGLSQRASVGGIDSAWDPPSSGGYGVPKDRDIAQCFEGRILMHGLLDLQESLGYPLPPRLLDRNALLKVIVKGATALNDNPLLNGTRKYVCVAKAGQPALSVISEGWGSDSTHIAALNARMWRATKDKRWLALLPSKAVLEAAIAKNESWAPAEWSIAALAVRQEAGT